VLYADFLQFLKQVRMAGQLFDDGGVTTISIRQFADAVGVTEGAIRKAIREGKFSKAAVITLANGKPALVEDQAHAEWEAFHPPGGGQAAPAGDVQSAAIDRAAEEARKARYQADLLELELQEARERLHDAELVLSIWSDHVTTAVARLNTLKTKLLAVLPGDALVNGRIIDDIVNEMRREMSIDPLEFRQAKRGRRRKAATAPAE